MISDNKSVDNQINTFLYLSLLNTLPPKDISNKTITLGKLDSSEIELANTKLSNSNRILGFDFNLEGCGAYCENYNMKYYFDTRNGRLLTSQELFNPKMIPQLANIINKDNITSIKQFLKNIKKEAKKSGRDKDEVEEQILMY